MAIQLIAHLNFRDNAREAMEFYHTIFGGELTLQTYKEFHASEQDPAEDDKIIHAVLTTPSFMLMAADTPNRMPYNADSNIFSLALNGDAATEAPLRGYFERLSDGGTVTMPLAKAQWNATFGMCRDKFGVRWMINIAA